MQITSKDSKLCSNRDFHKFKITNTRLIGIQATLLRTKSKKTMMKRMKKRMVLNSFKREVISSLEVTKSLQTTKKRTKSCKKIQLKMLDRVNRQ